ncbi:hypothetical protein, partial [Salmonella enterica]|uniref:hypothetical protein n=1 Tax=Salmonella enterica TaxID=28901 RepID=UPI0020C1F966
KKWPVKSPGTANSMEEIGQGRNGHNEKKENEDSLNSGYHGPVLRKKMLGEKGHGPVANGQWTKE